jgi:Kdo2-lipid IVA lauroyltransferase/acyltransferase
MSRSSRKRIQFYLMPLGSMLQTLLPRWLALRIAWLLAALAFPFLKTQRRVLVDNARRILGRELSPGEGDAYARRVLKNYATCTADLLRAPQMTRRRTLDRIVPHGSFREPLDRLLGGGRPGILVTGHVGNWDLAGVLIAYCGYPIVAVFERISQGMSDAFNRFRGTSGMELVAMGDREAMDRAIASGKLFVLVADRDLKGNGVELPWFSGRRKFPRGAAAFALRFNVPIVIGYMVLEPGDAGQRYRAQVEPPIEFQPSGDFTADVDALTARVTEELESVVARHPDQWFVFQPRWIAEGGEDEAHASQGSR